MVPAYVAWTRPGAEEKSKELAQYLRMEYGKAEAAWVGRSIRETLRQISGLRARLARRRARSRDVGSAPTSPVPAADGGAPTAFPVALDDCAHDDATPLGRDGPTIFARCRRCGALLIQAVEALYLLRPATRTADAGSPL